jgi:threonine/homoserine/homoserine lactone efflux protein
MIVCFFGSLNTSLWVATIPPKLVSGLIEPLQKIVKLYVNGLLVALTNPKAIAFTTALFPQFIQSDRPMLPQFSILIVTFMFLSFVCLLGYAMMAEGTKNRSAQIKVPGFMSKVFGCVFIGSGIFLATATQK